MAGWRAVFITWAVLCFASFVISSFFLKEDVTYAEKPKASSDLSLLRKKEAVLIMILFALLGALSRLLGTYLPTVFFKLGNSLDVADPLSAIFIATGILGGILGGRLVDRYEGRNITLVFFTSATGILAAMSFVTAIPAAAVLIAAAGLFVTGLYPIFYFMMRVVTSAKIVGVSYGLLLSIGMLSGIVSLPIGGYIIDISPQMLFLFAALLAFLGVIFSLRLTKLGERR
jgi:predicted MFS family arabinose efflux permease